MTGVLLALLALAMFSANVMLTRVATSRLATNVGFPITMLANIAFAALLFAIELVIRRQPLTFSGAGILFFALAGLFTTYLGRFFVLEVIARLGSAKASAFQVSSPLFTFVIALIFLGERLSAQALVGMIVTIFGLLLVALSGAPTATWDVAKATRQRWKDWLRSGFAIGAASSAAYGVGNVMRGAAVREWDEPILGALLGALVGLVLHFLFSSGHVEVFRALRTAHRGGLLLYATSGVLTITAQIVVIAAMKYAPVSVVALVTLCTPLLVFPASYFLLKNEDILPRTVIGALLTLGGIAMIILH
jgi:drug/metabolite transporter (DMT)-like permease